MSFLFSWEKLDDEVALQIEGMIHAHFQRIPKPNFMGNIAVSKFRFGSTPPNITVLDVTDPLEEWCVHMDQEEARLAQEAAEAGGGESMDEDELASGDDYEDDYSYSADGSIVMVGEGDDIEYLESGPFEERERMETEGWLHRQQRAAHRNEESSSSDSFKEELQGTYRARSTTNSRNGGSASEQDIFAPTPAGTERQHYFRSAATSPTKVSPPSPSSSASSESSNQAAFFGHSVPSSTNHQGTEHETVSYAQTLKRSNRNLKVDTDTGLPSTTPYNVSNTFSKKTPGTSHSLSSHASDDDIESEAFYTHGESTIYQRMKNLVLESSNLMPPKAASSDDGESHHHHQQLPHHHQHQHQHSHHPQLGTSLFSPSTPGPSGNMSGGLGLGLSAGIGTNPGSVLSSVMQSRQATRPLSATSFYSSPATAAATSSTNAASGQQAPQLYFPDISGMVVSGNSLLGLRAGTPSRTMPGTPRGFESPTLAFSRRQSFSDTVGDESHSSFSTDIRPGASPSELQNREQRDSDHHNPAVYMSPVEALSFDAFSHQPRVVERLKDAENQTATARTRSSSMNHASSGRSLHGDQRPRSSSMRHDSNNHHHQHQHRPPTTRLLGRPMETRSHLEKRRRKKRGDVSGDGLDRGELRTPASYSPSIPTMSSKRHENDIQLLLSVQYQGQMGFTVETELLLNYPTFAFLALPVKLVITGFSFKAKVLMGYLRDHVNVCFLEPEDPNESILSNVRIESQVGDEQKQAVLKNVGKIERFVVEQLRKFITEDFVYPSYHSIELLRAPAAAQPGPPSSSPSAVPSSAASTTTSAHLRGASPALSSTAASVATNHTRHTGAMSTATSSASRAERRDGSSLRARSSQAASSAASTGTMNYRNH